MSNKVIENSTNSNKKPLTILVIAADVVGRVNACAGLTFGLLSRGHRVVFFTESSFAGRMTSQGFEEFVYELNFNSNTNKNHIKNMKPGQKTALGMFENKVIGSYEPLEKIRNLLNMFLYSPNAKNRIIAQNDAIKRVLNQICPDLIVVDNTFLPPAIHYCGIPWINCISTSPLYCIYDNTFQVPPGGSGFDSRYVDKDSWTEFNNVRHNFFYSPIFSSYLEEMGYKKYDNDIRIPNSSFMTCYCWPKEIVPDYIPNEHPTWFNVETFNRNWKSIELESIVPKKLFHEKFAGRFSGKWIYLSMGTMGCIDIELMKRLISMLPGCIFKKTITNNQNNIGETYNESNDLCSCIHKLLVSLGPKEHEIRDCLPENAFGERYFAQTSILPNIDLLITHGGNNTVTEAIARGVPMLVLPLFADQYDNAQRLHELKLGIRLDPYRCTKIEFQSAIDSLLNNETLRDRLKSISRRIQSDDRHCVLYDKIESKFCQ